MDSWTTPLTPGTRTGVVAGGPDAPCRFGCSPSPTTPASRLPQADTLPSRCNARAEPPAAAICTTSARPATRTGLADPLLNGFEKSREDSGPLPIWPASARPQATTVPSASSAYEVPSPAATSVALPDSGMGTGRLKPASRRLLPPAAPSCPSSKAPQPTTWPSVASSSLWRSPTILATEVAAGWAQIGVITAQASIANARLMKRMPSIIWSRSRAG